jgi:hypothetical protein
MRVKAAPAGRKADALRMPQGTFRDKKRQEASN